MFTNHSIIPKSTISWSNLLIFLLFFSQKIHSQDSFFDKIIPNLKQLESEFQDSSITVYYWENIFRLKKLQAINISTNEITYIELNIKKFKQKKEYKKTTRILESTDSSAFFLLTLDKNHFFNIDINCRGDIYRRIKNENYDTILKEAKKEKKIYCIKKGHGKDYILFNVSDAPHKVDCFVKTKKIRVAINELILKKNST